MEFLHIFFCVCELNKWLLLKKEWGGECNTMVVTISSYFIGIEYSIYPIIRIPNRLSTDDNK